MKELSLYDGPLDPITAKRVSGAMTGFLGTVVSKEIVKNRNNIVIDVGKREPLSLSIPSKFDADWICEGQKIEVDPANMKIYCID